MRVLVVLSRFPWPLDKGDKLRAYNQIRILSREHEIVLAALSEHPVNPRDIQELEPYCSEIHVFPLSKTKVILNLFSAIPSSIPFQTCYFNSSKARTGLELIRNRFKPEVEYYQLIRTSSYLGNNDCYRILDYMDALSEGMSRRAAKSGFPLNLLWQKEAKRLAKLEKELYGSFNAHTIISGQDASWMDLPGPVTLVPNGTDRPELKGLNAYAPDGPVLFHGNLSYPPNERAAIRLAGKIMPAVRATLRGKFLRLSGASPSSEVKKLASEFTQVTGWVENLRDVFSGASVFAAPFETGTGMQNKLLEAMTAGLPCITNRQAADAFGADAGVHLLVANTDQEFSDAIIELCSNPALASEIVSNAYKLVAEFTWENKTSPLRELINRKKTPDFQ